MSRDVINAFLKESELAKYTPRGGQWYDWGKQVKIIKWIPNKNYFLNLWPEKMSWCQIQAESQLEACRYINGACNICFIMRKLIRSQTECTARRCVGKMFCFYLNFYFIYSDFFFFFLQFFPFFFIFHLFLYFVIFFNFFFNFFILHFIFLSFIEFLFYSSIFFTLSFWCFFSVILFLFVFFFLSQFLFLFFLNLLFFIFLLLISLYLF